MYEIYREKKQEDYDNIRYIGKFSLKHGVRGGCTVRTTIQKTIWCHVLMTTKDSLGLQHELLTVIPNDITLVLPVHREPGSTSASWILCVVQTTKLVRQTFPMHASALQVILTLLLQRIDEMHTMG